MDATWIALSAVTAFTAFATALEFAARKTLSAHGVDLDAMRRAAAKE